MSNHKAMKDLVGTKIAEFSRRLGPGYGTSKLYKWLEPYQDDDDSGRRGPGEIMEQMIEIGMALDVPRKTALSPLFCLNRRFGILPVDLKSFESRKIDNKALTSELCRTMKEFADLVRVASEGMEDGDISRTDDEKNWNEGWEAIGQIYLFMMASKAARRK